MLTDRLCVLKQMCRGTASWGSRRRGGGWRWIGCYWMYLYTSPCQAAHSEVDTRPKWKKIKARSIDIYTGVQLHQASCDCATASVAGCELANKNGRGCCATVAPLGCAHMAPRLAPSGRVAQTIAGGRFVLQRRGACRGGGTAVGHRRSGRGDVPRPASPWRRITTRRRGQRDGWRARAQRHPEPRLRAGQVPQP